jgi:hypothetical protein
MLEVISYNQSEVYMPTCFFGRGVDDRKELI